MDDRLPLGALPERCGARLAQVEEWVKAVAWGSAAYGHILHARLSPELRQRGLPLGAGCRDIGALILDRCVSEPAAGFTFDDVIQELLGGDLALETRGRDPGLPIRCVFTHLDYRGGEPRIPLVENEAASFALLGVASPSSERLPRPSDASMCETLAFARTALLSILHSLAILDVDVPAYLGILNRVRREQRDLWPPDVARDVVGTGLFFGYFLSARSVAHFAKLHMATSRALQEPANTSDLSASEYWLRDLVAPRGYGGVQPVRFTGRHERNYATRPRCLLGAVLFEAMVCRLGLTAVEGLRVPGSGGYRAFQDAVRHTTLTTCVERREDKPDGHAARSEMEHICLRTLWDACLCAEDRAVYGPVTENLVGTKNRTIEWTEIAQSLAASVSQSQDPELLRSRLGVEARKLTPSDIDKPECLQAIKQRAKAVWRGIRVRAAPLLGEEFRR